MSYTKTEELFSREYLCDKKHKLNTSPKRIPEAILDEIESKGLTIERIDELARKGFDIYKYSTQITLHGVCDELSKDGRLGYYKCLALNKNKSIGIKWIAVDRAKKSRIINMLSECGWDCENNSTSYHPIRVKRVKDIAEAKAVASEWKADLERIDHKLFYGTSSVFLSQIPWYGLYVVCSLIVNGIKKNNVEKLIEQASGKSIAEIEAIRTARLEKEKAEHEAWEAKYEAEKAQRDNEASKYNGKFVDEILLPYYDKAISNELPVGTIVGVLNKDYNGKYKLDFYRIEKRTAKACHEDGTNDWTRENCQKLIKKPCKCYVKATA